MAYNVRILADSLSPDGDRLTTMEWTFPRFILAEFNTHRMVSKNAASSRAIPVQKRIDAVMSDPFIPEFAKNQKGMQAGEEFYGEEQLKAEIAWIKARDYAVLQAEELKNQDAHKQYVNRLLEPFSWVTVIATATDWANLFALRCHPAAQPEFQRVAYMALNEYLQSKPRKVDYGEWHRPLIYEQDEEEVVTYVAKLQGKYPTFGISMEEQVSERLNKISAGRCARVSYLSQDGKRDHEKDIELYSRLVNNTPRHSSPCEHVATPAKPEDMVYRADQLEVKSGKISPKEGEVGYCGNFKGWKQLRKFIPDENVTSMQQAVDGICLNQILSAKKQEKV